MTPDEMQAAVIAAAPHSDRGVLGLHLWAKAFIAAHERQRGLSIEIGTREGGGSLLFLKLLERLYPDAERRPFLFTVDPYGSKPYESGSAGVERIPAYTSGHYLAMKARLASFPNHAHWLMSSEDFLHACYNMTLWQLGEDTAEIRDTRTGGLFRVPVGDPEPVAYSVVFALLDGDHDAGSIGGELRALDLNWLAPRATVVVDNADCDRDTESTVRSFAGRHGYTVATPAPDIAVVTRG